MPKNKHFSPHARKKLEVLVSLIFATHRAIRDRVEEGYEIDPFTVLRLEALRFIVLAKRPTMKEVALNLRITPPSVSKLVSSLIKVGYVSQKEGKADKRTKHLIATRKGKQFLREGFAKVERSMQATLSKLSDKDIDELIKTLRRLMDIYSDKN